MREHRSFSSDYRRSIDAGRVRRVFPRAQMLWIPSFERSVLNLRGKWWDFAVYRLGNVCFREHTGDNGDTYLSIGLLIGWSVIFIVEYFYFEIRFVWKEIKKSLVFNLNGYTFQLKRDNQKIVKNSILMHISLLVFVKYADMIKIK